MLHLGAHFGEEADCYDALSWDGDPMVVWVEADPAHLTHLHANVDHRPGHRVIAALVDEEAGREVVLHRASNEGASSSVLDLGTHANVLPHITYVDQVPLTTTTVDDLDGLDAVNVVVLDLQGLELRALRGAGRLLEHVDYVYSEVNREPLYVGCPLIGELDEHLAGFARVKTTWTEWGYGDALWVAKSGIVG